MTNAMFILLSLFAFYVFADNAYRLKTKFDKQREELRQAQQRERQELEQWLDMIRQDFEKFKSYGDKRTDS